MTGTIGCMVIENTGNRNHLLTSCHVVGKSHSPVIGLPIWQPGALDGGSSSDLIGSLSGYVPIALGGTQANEVDAALVLLDKPTDAMPGVRSIGSVYGPNANPPLRGTVVKNGWTTHVTAGTLTYKGMTFLVTYPAGDALFTQQYGVVGNDGKRFAAAGDSGSLVLNERQEPIAIVMAVASKTDLTLCNPIIPVLSQLKVRPA